MDPLLTFNASRLVCARFRPLNRGRHIPQARGIYHCQPRRRADALGPRRLHPVRRIWISLDSVLLLGVRRKI